MFSLLIHSFIIRLSRLFYLLHYVAPFSLVELAVVMETH